MTSHPNRSRRTITLDARQVSARWRPDAERWQDAMQRAVKQKWGSTADVSWNLESWSDAISIFHGTVFTRPRDWQPGDGSPVQAELWLTVPRDVPAPTNRGSQSNV